MIAFELVNIGGALALTLSEGLLRDVEDQALKPGQAAAAIALLRHKPGMAIEPARRALRLSHPGAVRLFDRLVAGLLLVRLRSPTDRRAVAVHLTEAREQWCDTILADGRGS